MADPLKTFSFLLDQELESVKGELVQLASKTKVMGGTQDKTKVHARLEIDLEQVLETSASVRLVSVESST